MQPIELLKYFCIFGVTFASLNCTHIEQKFSPHDTVFQPSQKEKLQAKYDKYLQLARQQYVAKGYMNEKCDALLFTSLFSVAGGNVDMTPFEFKDRPGKWDRNPSHDCYPNGVVPDFNVSTISRDMFTGLAWWLWLNKKKQEVDEIIFYGDTHLWVMGDASSREIMLGRTLMSPALMATYYELRYRMGGADSKERDIPRVFTPQKSFPRHLSVLHIGLLGFMRGELELEFLAILDEAATTQKRNALYNAMFHIFTDGNQENAINSLLDESLFPANSLPTSANYCTHYLFQRDEGTDDWAPCPQENDTHSGVDFLFAAKLVLDSAAFRK